MHVNNTKVWNPTVPHDKTYFYQYGKLNNTNTGSIVKVKVGN